MRISDWSSDVCSSDLGGVGGFGERGPVGEEVVAVGLQGVGVVFVEVDAGEVGGAEQEEGGCCVALAYGGGGGGEVAGGAFAAIGRAEFRDRRCHAVYIYVGAVSLKKKKQEQTT